MKFKLLFLEPTVLHPYSKTETIFEVAKYLEKKYALTRRFYYDIKLPLVKRLLKAKTARDLFVISEWLKNQWREWILGEKSGLTSEAAKKRGDPAFVDSQAYFLNMNMKIIQS